MSIFGLGQSKQRPTAFQTLLSAGAYGQAIALIFGMTRVAIYPIWAADLRIGGSDKKLKGKKKGPPSYVENVDYLIGQNPILNIQQIWTNNNVKYPLNFLKYTVTPGPSSAIAIPDAQFYSVIAVTVNATIGTAGNGFKIVFNDYGGQGPVEFVGTCEIPIWNACLCGPDPLNNKGWNQWPNTYRWLPSYGPVIYYDPEQGATGIQPSVPGFSGGGGTWNIYYAQKSIVISHQTPLHRARLTFEQQCGNGPEYAAAGLTSQQIIYPQYGGAGSPDIDLGSEGILPQLNLEAQAAHSYYSTGDCDFADMIEDIVKSGLSQAAVDIATLQPGYSPIQHGVNLNDFPGMVQKKFFTDAASIGGGTPNQMLFDLPVGKGNILLALFQGNNSTSNAVSDSLGNVWNLLYDTGTIDHSCARWALNTTHGLDTVTFDWSGGTLFNIIQQIVEIQGVNELDGNPVSAVSPGAGLPLTLAIQTTGEPTLLVCAVTGAGGIPPGRANDPSWIIDSPPFQRNFGGITLMHKIAPFPGTYSNTVYMGAGRGAMAIFAFKLNDPPNYPKAVGNIMEPDSLDLCRMQCRANGLWGSWDIDAQRKAQDHLESLYVAMDSAPVWSGDVLKSIPYSEVSYVGNGAIYNAPTASGPIAILTESDFIAKDGDPPITVSRKSQMDADNIFQIEHMNRNSDYATIITSQPEPLNASKYGPRKAPPVVLHMIQDVLVARKLVAIMVRRQTYLRNTYKWTMKADHALLEAMDLVVLNEPRSGVNMIPVRLTSVVENDSFDLECEAEEFFYGVHAPDPALTVTTPAPYIPSSQADPGPVNAPIIFEAIPRLSPGINLPQLEMAVSGASANYGGCLVYVSTDGGASYNPLNPGTITGNAAMGVTIGDWPAHADPDTADSLLVDLAESNGVLQSYAAQDRDQFTYPCYVQGGTAAIPYELMTYGMAVLGSASFYTLLATGTGNELRRSVFGAPTPNQGVDHPSGSAWAFLGAPESPAPGIFRTTIDPKWIGVTLYFKFVSFNITGLIPAGVAAALAAATAYPFTIAGTVGTPNPNQFAYTITPALALTQTSSTNIHMVQVTANFPSNQTIYNARDFTISAPSVPTTYWVTIYDPHFVGDTDATTNLTAYADPNANRVGQDGYIYIGSITVTPGMTPPPITTPGGLPVSNTTLLTFDGI